MKRILIIGISGTGKTTASIEIAEKFKLTLFHMDEFWWGKNWEEQEESKVEQKIINILEEDSWVIEGYIGPATKKRLQRADKIIYLDYSGVLASVGAIQRWLKFRGDKRPEMADGCIEKWNGLFFLKTILFRKERPEIEQAVFGFEDKILRLKSRKQLKAWINKY